MNAKYLALLLLKNEKLLPIQACFPSSCNILLCLSLQGWKSCLLLVIFTKYLWKQGQGLVSLMQETFGLASQSLYPSQTHYFPNSSWTLASPLASPQRGYQNWTWSSSLEFSLICCTSTTNLMSSAKQIQNVDLPCTGCPYQSDSALSWEKVSRSQRSSLNSFKSGWQWFVRIKISC